MKELFKCWYKTSREIQQEEWDKPYKEITNRHFNTELIDWNVQTSMYDLLTNVIFNIDDVHLKHLLGHIKMVGMKTLKFN